MVALHVIHPIVLRAEDLRIDPRASNDPYTIAQMVEDSYGADSFPLPSHGWPPPNEVTQWLDAATVVLATENLLVRSAGSYIAALAMSDFDSVVDANGVSRVRRRHSSSDILHWLEASALLLTKQTTETSSSSLGPFIFTFAR